MPAKRATIFNPENPLIFMIQSSRLLLVSKTAVWSLLRADLQLRFRDLRDAMFKWCHAGNIIMAAFSTGFSVSLNNQHVKLSATTSI